MTGEQFACNNFISLISLPDVPPDSHYTDHQLFAAIANGDEDAFRKIFHAYNKALFPFVLSVVKSESDAREVMQNVFLKLWLNRDKLKEIENPGGWLHTIASNACLDHLRKQATYEQHLTKAKTLQPLSDDDTTLQIDAREVKRALNEAVEQLPIRRREIFQLSKIDGLSRKEIAEQLNISENTVRNQLAEAVSFVQDYLRSKNIMVPVVILMLILK